MLNEDEQLDVIYESFNDYMVQNNLQAIEESLISVDIPNTATVLLIGYLTACIPVKSRLQNRSKFFSDVQKELQSRGEIEPGLLEGLE